MRKIMASALVLAALVAPAQAQFFGLFDYYQEPRIPPTGDCNVNPWYGEFAGSRYNTYTDSYSPTSARGCFSTEAECRLWQNEAISTLYRGPLYYATCRPR
jgi:hypothetical protein